MSMIHMRHLAALALLASSAAQPAGAQTYSSDLAPTPVIAEAGQRYILMVLDQADRNLNIGSAKINVLVDTKTGKTWVLDYAVKPNSNEKGFVWSEIPFAKPPQ